MTDMSKGVERLRQLLFDKETALIETVDQRVARLADRVRAVETETEAEKKSHRDALGQLEVLLNRAGTEERFRSSVVEVLDEALTQAEREKQPEMSRALAPLVVKTVKAEIRGSKDEMVEALYPITGQLVKAYVASAMRDLADDINRRLEKNALMLRLRSWTTGRAYSDLAMADTQQLDLDELFLIRRGSGELLARWPDGERLSNSDVHLSGLMTAITEFAGHAFGEQGGTLRNFEADGYKVFLRASPSYLLAAKCTGQAPISVARVLDQEFMELLSTDAFKSGEPLYGSENTGQELGATADDLKTKIAQTYEDLQASGTGYGLLKFLLFLIAVPIFAWLAWSFYTGLEQSRVEKIAREQIAFTQELKGYETNLDVGYRGRTVKIRGLTPNENVRDDLVRRLNAVLPDTTKLTTEFAVLPKAEQAPDARPLVARLRTQLQVIEGELRQSALLRTVTRSNARLVQALSDADQLGESLKDATQRDKLANARAIALEASTALTKLKSELEQTAKLPNGDGLLALKRSLSQVAGAVAQADAALPTGGNVSPQRALRVDGAVDVIAEDLSTRVERFGATVIAMRQVARIKPVEPKTIVQRFEPQIVQRVEPTVRPVDRIASWTRRNAIFFSNGVDFRDGATTADQLDELAELLKRADVLVRVVGFTDERGGLSRNNTLARARAQRVFDELRDRGVSARQMVAVGRGAGRDLSTDVGANSPNRRVEFEIGFIGEASPRP